jgi:anti-anti-sigma regulatory factor
MVGRAEEIVMYADKQLVIRRTSDPTGLRFNGTIDLFNVDSVAKSLNSALDGEGDLHIDSSMLEFCDVSGIRALVAAAESVSGRRRLVLHGLPPQLRTVMTVVGWTDLPGLVIAESEAAQQ